MTYQLYHLDGQNKLATLAQEAPHVIQANQAADDAAVNLTGAFGSWQVTVEPEKCLGAITDGQYVASCKERIQARRVQLAQVVGQTNAAKVLSLGSSPCLGTQN